MLQVGSYSSNNGYYWAMKSSERLVNERICYIPTKVNKILGNKDIASQLMIDECLCMFYIFQIKPFLDK